MKKHKKLILMVVYLILLIWTLWGNTAIEINEYTVSSPDIPQAFSGFRIAQVSDLHNADYWTENGDMIRKLTEAKPDIIVITGDMIDSNHTDIPLALDYAKQMLKIAPTYYVTGNHESWVSDYKSLKSGLEDLGVVVLNNEKLTLERQGAQLDLIGIDDPGFLTRYYDGDESHATEDVLTDLVEDSENFSILLAHRPELFDVYAACGADLIFSGHAHGGQFRFPLIGGLIAPNQGLFPRYDAGEYTQDGSTMIVSRGLGNSVIPIRFNNRPEIPVVILKSA